MQCPCCGNELKDDPALTFMPERRAVVRNGQVAVLSPLQYKVVEALRRRNLTISELIEVVYAHDDEPDCAQTTLHVTMMMASKRLKPLGIRVGAPRRGPNACNQIIYVD